MTHTQKKINRKKKKKRSIVTILSNILPPLIIVGMLTLATLMIWQVPVTFSYSLPLDISGMWEESIHEIDVAVYDTYNNRYGHAERVYFEGNSTMMTDLNYTSGMTIRLNTTVTPILGNLSLIELKKYEFELPSYTRSISLLFWAIGQINDNVERQNFTILGYTSWEVWNGS